MSMDKCPVCGYTDKSIPNPVSNAMSYYIQVSNPSRRVLLNNDKESVELGEDKVKYIREDLYKAPVIATSGTGAAIPNPTTSAAEVKK